MASINWSTVLRQAIAAAENVLGDKWQVVSTGATSQITNLTNTAEFIALNKNNMTPAEYNAILAIQQLALQNVLLIYEDIGIASAEQAVQAAWGVIGSALKTATGLAIKL